mmetsp:Transcript_11442/g.42967  ORF Transcript_11442/g.42967 Transcript_11442/m.42967 type:complete len:205 (-) Transcript_11442:475-1089(-)
MTSDKNTSSHTPNQNEIPPPPHRGEATLGQKLQAVKDPNYMYKQMLGEQPKSLFHRLWEKTGQYLGTSGDSIIYSRFVKMCFFPISILSIAIFSIYNPAILPWNSYERMYKKFVDRHGTGEEYLLNKQFIQQAQQDALLLEMRQREVASLERWHAVHPHEAVTAKVKRRLRNQIITEMMEKYDFGSLPDAAAAAAQEQQGGDAL